MLEDPLTQAIEAAGGAEGFCAALGISKRTLFDWRKLGVPDTRAHAVAAVSRGAVSAAQLATQRIQRLAPRPHPSEAA